MLHIPYIHKGKNKKLLTTHLHMVFTMVQSWVVYFFIKWFENLSFYGNVMFHTRTLFFGTQRDTSKFRLNLLHNHFFLFSIKIYIFNFEWWMRSKLLILLGAQIFMMKPCWTKKSNSSKSFRFTQDCYRIGGFDVNFNHSRTFLLSTPNWICDWKLLISKEWIEFKYVGSNSKIDWCDNAVDMTKKNMNELQKLLFVAKSISFHPIGVMFEVSSRFQQLSVFLCSRCDKDSVCSARAMQ